MKYVLLMFSVFVLCSCSMTTEEKRFKESVDFCGDSVNIKEYRTLSSFSTVECLDGRVRESRD